MSRPNLQYVVLDNPKQCWSEPAVRRFFERMVTIRLEGYGSYYPEYWLPLDRADYYGIHILICDSREGKLIPLACVKHTTRSRYEYYRDAFPPDAVMKTAEEELDRQRVAEALNDLRSRGEELIYASGWASDPSIRRDRELSQTLKEMVFAGLSYLPMQLGIREWWCFATPRTKTDEWFFRMGMTPLCKPFHFVSHDVVLVRSGHLTKVGAEILERYRPQWDRRIEFRSGHASGALPPSAE